MRKILGLLYRSRIFLLFIALEAIAFIWIGHSRSYQRAVLINSSNQVTGYILEKTEDWQDYLELKTQNEKLAKENARLRGVDSVSLYSLTAPHTTINDSLSKVRYTYLEAEVVNSSYMKARNYMTINRGKVHGVEPNMGIIGSYGVVGVVKDVSEHFCTAIPLINPSFRVSGRIQSNMSFGPVEWKGSNYQYTYLSDIPRHVAITIGDTVVTDSRSQIFPQGLLIGTIESYELQEDQNFNELKLHISTDFSSLDHVYIIKDLMKTELQELESKLPK
jgi:rod shape-determining protein MreC